MVRADPTSFLAPCNGKAGYSVVIIIRLLSGQLRDRRSILGRVKIYIYIYIYIFPKTPRTALEPTISYSYSYSVGIWAFPLGRKQLQREADFCPLSGSKKYCSYNPFRHT